MLSALCALCVSAIVLSGTGGASTIRTQDLKEWLSYISSDELQGRAVYSAGLGLAAAYIEDHLKAWGIQPARDHGHYLQAVRVLGVKTTSHSSVTVDVNGESRTFADGAGITLPKNVGGKRRFTIDRVEFAGYGLDAPDANHMDFRRGKDVRNAAVVCLGASGPKNLDQSFSRRLLAGRNRYAIERLGAAAAIGVSTAGAGRAARTGRAGGAGGAGEAESAGEEGQAAGTGRPGGFGGRGTPLPTPDFTTVQRLDSPIAPSVTADDRLFESCSVTRRRSTVLKR